MKNEAWKEGWEYLIGPMHKCINEVWMKGEIPEKWKEGIVKPIYKKGEEDKVENYRGIFSMDVKYKIYTKILINRLVGELEEKGCLDDTQKGYRPGRGTMDAAYVLKTGIEIEIEIRKPKGKAYVMFTDVKGAFDKVKREEL